MLDSLAYATKKQQQQLIGMAGDILPHVLLYPFFAFYILLWKHVKFLLTTKTKQKQKTEMYSFTTKGYII